MKGQELTKVENQAEVLIGETVSAEAEAANLQDLYFVMGGLDAISTIATNLHSALIIKFQQIRDRELYRAAGFDRFDDFMDKFPRSPMGYKRFNYIENIFKGLGADVFDLTSSAGLSARQQKLLGKGNVEIEGSVVRVTIDDKTEEIDITNRREWLESLKTLADANAEKSIKLDRQKEKIDRHDTEKRDLYDEIDRVRASRSASPDDHMIARVELGLAFDKLTRAAAGLNDIERDQLRDNVLEDVAAWSATLRTAYRTSTGTRTSTEPNLVGDTFDEALGNFLDSVDLDTVDNNDGELAAKL